MSTKIMAKNFKKENGMHLQAIRSPYDGRVIGWIDITDKNNRK